MSQLKDVFDVEDFIQLLQMHQNQMQMTVPDFAKWIGLDPWTLRLAFRLTERHRGELSLSLSTACLCARKLGINLNDYIIPLEES